MTTLPRPLLSLITDQTLARERVEAAAAAACRAGCRLVQLRDRCQPTAELFELARSLRTITAKHGALLVINDRVDVALAVGADGVHLPAAGMAPQRARRLLGRERLLGRSVHSPREARTLTESGLDYLQFGPVYATASKATYGPPQGLDELAATVDAAAGLAVVAVGGIVAGRVAEVMRRGASGVAVIGAVMRSASPAEATTELLEAIGSPNR